ncbi:MAG: hypothetical protein WCG81_14600, partial [Candidatus Angelobacter sp.]
GPSILVVAPDSCGTAAAPILNLQSELLPPDITPPTVASCSLPSSSADKVIIVDAGSGRTCEADDPSNPDDECLRRPQNKKPFYLDRGDTVNVMITNKNPFRETYKFSSNETVLKDDDIGSFLALLVPSLGGGSSKQSTDASTSTTGDAKTSASTSAKTFDSELPEAQAFVERVEGAEPQRPSIKESPKAVTQIDIQMQNWSKEEQKTATAMQDFENAQQKVKAVLPPKTAADVESLHREAQEALNQSHAFIERAKETHSGHQSASEQEEKAAHAQSRQVPQEQAQKEFDLYKKASDELKIANERLNDVQSLIQQQINKNNACTDVVRQRVDNLVLNYRYFASTYNEIRNQLVSANGKDNPQYCTNLLNNANGLWEILNRENEKLLDTQLGLNLRDAAALLALQKPLDLKNVAGKTSTQAQAGNLRSNPPAEPPVPANLGAGAITSSICFMKALHAQVSPVLSSSIGALEPVLVNPNSLVSSFQIGPFADPTQVDWTLTRTIIKPSISGISVAAFNTAIDDCISPPPAKTDTTKTKDNSARTTVPGSKLLPVATGWSQARVRNASFNLADLAIAHPIPALASPSASQKSGKKSGSKPSASKSSSSKDSSTSGSGDNSPDNASSQQSPSGSSGDDSTVTTRGKRINFGKERFIVSIGAVWAHLSQQNIGTGLGIPKFDPSGNPLPAPTPSPAPSPAPTPPAITTIITQTNHSSFRISPMAFLNTRLFEWNKSNEPVYFTFGITAKSSDAGVKPEYLLGLSQSLCDRHLFLTAGAYLGQQSYLAGNLKFNQQVPSGLTGSPPINSVYGAGFSFGISWRVPGLAK